MIGTALDPVLAFLIPLFLKAANGDTDQARHAAVQLLDCYGATTDADRLLAAEIIAFSFATLDNLSRSLADQQMSVATCLRLRGNANALSRAGERNRQALAKAKKTDQEPATQAAVSPAFNSPTLKSPALPASMRQIRDLIVDAAPSLAEKLTAAGTTMSREQRRYLTRKAEEARAARDREARQALRRAERATARGVAECATS